MTFGEKIRNLRKSKNMNQTQLANSIVFAVLIVTLLVRPAGLLGKYVPEKV